MRKRVAVLVSQVDEATQRRFLIEFIGQAYDYDYDVCIFSAYQKYQDTVLRDIGDSNIFSLVNFKRFEAILILSDTILNPGVAASLQDSIHKSFDGPVLVVDQDSPYFATVKIDHYTPMRKIVDHLIEVHGYSEIAFLGGKEGHPHSVQRLSAFLDSMKWHNLEVHDEWIFHGNYWYDSADEFADILLKNSGRLPRAIVCANDFMAIGMAARLTESGIKVPEDVAITGYDSVEQGKHSPKPLTSADIPADELGRYCMQWLHAKLTGQTPEPFNPEAPIFVGGSCGCRHEMEMVPKALRARWRTQESSKSMFADFNHFVEDLFEQRDLKNFLRIISEYAYQIRPFSRFDICLNEGFMSPASFVGEDAIRQGYAENMHRVLSCGKETGIIDFYSFFSSRDMLPELDDTRDYPTTFIFNPLYFDDRCYGYTVLNHGTDVALYNEGFRIWMRNIMQGMEAFYRQGYMLELIENIKAEQIRDSLTGLYNYEGFIKILQSKMEEHNESKMLNIISIDIKGIKAITEVYGRETGERAIQALARTIQGLMLEGEYCCRMYNDEFLVALPDTEQSDRGNALIDSILSQINSVRLVEDTDYQIQLYTSSMLGNPHYFAGIDELINQAISIKNHKKNISSQDSSMEEQDVMEEIARNQLVMQILNDNSLTYHYQPIVKASDGSIYAFEALMRYEPKKITPLQILSAASYLGRLGDVERATMLNVTADVEKNLELFGAAKIFINSMPGVGMSAEDEKEFGDRLRRNDGRFVIEITEDSELTDKQLFIFKKKLESVGGIIALDDFGAGYSNVNNLLRYSPSLVKLDRMLITNIHENPQKQHMVKSIIEYAHDNDIVALAEGVESKEELQECVRLGVDLIQGYYTGKATRIPIKEINVKVRSEIERANQYSVWGV